MIGLAKLLKLTLTGEIPVLVELEDLELKTI